MDVSEFLVVSGAKVSSVIARPLVTPGDPLVAGSYRPPKREVVEISTKERMDHYLSGGSSSSSSKPEVPGLGAKAVRFNAGRCLSAVGRAFGGCNWSIQ